MAGDSEPPLSDLVDRRREGDDVVLDMEGGKGVDMDSKERVDEEREKVGAKADLEEGKSAVVVIDVKRGRVERKVETEKECRICHLSSDCNLKEGAELIQLGCACKNDLGTAHRHCAEAWFKLRGGRIKFSTLFYATFRISDPQEISLQVYCEICGVCARNVNVTGMEDNTFMEGWSDGRVAIMIDDDNYSERCQCWNGQPFCNFLMACLVIAFILPWFFRVNMF